MSKTLPDFQKGDTTNLLQELTNALLRGGECVGYEAVAVTDLAIATLTVPATATYALIVVIGDTTVANPSRVIHWRMDGGNPATGVAGAGIPIGNNGEMEIKNAADLANFKAIGIEGAKTHSLRVAYFE